jgi:hypothetical protein
MHPIANIANIQGLSYRYSYYVETVPAFSSSILAVYTFHIPFDVHQSQLCDYESPILSVPLAWSGEHLQLRTYSS